MNRVASIVVVAGIWTSRTAVGFQPCRISSVHTCNHHDPSPCASAPIRKIPHWISFKVQSQYTRLSLAIDTSSLTTDPVVSSSSSDSSQVEDEVTRWRQEAERMRLEAAQMDLSLTLRKIETIENKLKNKRQLERNPQDREELERQLDSLKVKLRQSIEGPSTISDSATAVAVPSKQYTTNGVITAPMQESRIISELTPLDGISATIDATPPTSKPKRPKPDVPLNGFDETDLKLYLPVAENIETTMPNATIHEKLAAFRAVPSLREHFQEKVRRTFVEPMEDLKKLEDLRNRYLYSSSSVEKTQIKRELDQLERTIQDENVYTYSESVYLDLPPLLEDELQARVEAISSLPPTLQALYKRAQNLKVEDELQLAIMMDYYENQMQLLEQLQKYAPLCSELLDETRQAIESLPRKLQDYLALQLGLDEGYSIQALVKALENGGYDGTDAAWTDLRNTIFEAASETTLPDLPEYRDIDFIDRSRYVEEFYPCVARMEGQHPTQKQVDAFIGKLGRKTFMVTSKPERVLGGWYVRGENLLSEDERGAKLVSAIEKRIDGELKERLEFFYLPDPAPLSDELIEMGYVSQQLILVTSRNETAFYNYGAPVTKGVVSALGMLSLFMFSGVVSELQPTVREQVDATLVNGGDLSWFADSSLQIVGACLVIQAAHELAHRFVAKRDRFDIGLPTSIPSIQLGLLGSVTPIKSPPPSLISMFDFALAGPIAGLGVSMIFLLYGLQVTASMSASELAQLPALPVELVRSSALAGGLVEEVLGKATLFGSATTAGSILPLHPLAISGFVGVVSNALALLPLGNTDGGRISVAIFGRRFAFIVNGFTAMILCLAGVLGADDSNILLVYTLFSLIWQKELEGPARNEVEEVDLGRSALAFGAALLVGLALAPLPM